VAATNNFGCILRTSSSVEELKYRLKRSVLEGLYFRRITKGGLSDGVGSA
jgi:hypothetical protein